MSPSRVETTSVVSVMCSLSLAQLAADFKSLEAQIVATVEQSGRAFYAQVVRAFQERWLEQHRSEWTAVRWRTIDQLSPLLRDVNISFWLFVRPDMRVWGQWGR